jgi:hypothetical protein
LEILTPVKRRTAARFVPESDWKRAATEQRTSAEDADGF